MTSSLCRPISCADDQVRLETSGREHRWGPASFLPVPAASFNVLTSVLASIPSPSSDSFEVGPLTFRYYGLMIALGVLAAVEIARAR